MIWIDWLNRIKLTEFFTLKRILCRIILHILKIKFIKIKNGLKKFREEKIKIRLSKASKEISMSLLYDCKIEKARQSN